MPSPTSTDLQLSDDLTEALLCVESAASAVMVSKILGGCTPWGISKLHLVTELLDQVGHTLTDSPGGGIVACTEVDQAIITALNHVNFEGAVRTNDTDQMAAEIRSLAIRYDEAIAGQAAAFLSEAHSVIGGRLRARRMVDAA